MCKKVLFHGMCCIVHNMQNSPVLNDMLEIIAHYNDNVTVQFTDIQKEGSLLWDYM